MRAETLVQVEKGDWRRKCYEISPIDDQIVMTFVKEMEECCDNHRLFSNSCQAIHDCLSLFDKLCDLAVEGMLSNKKAQELATKFEKIKLKSRVTLAVVTGLAIYSSKGYILTKLMGAGVIACRGYFGASLPLS